MIILTDAEEVSDKTEHLPGKRRHVKGPQGALCCLQRRTASPRDQDPARTPAAASLRGCTALQSSQSDEQDTKGTHTGTGAARLFCRWAIRDILRLPLARK